MPAQPRPYDLVLFGATGFTGGLTAEYLARNVPAGCRWAVAGRNPAKLEQLRARLAAIDPACAELPLLRADAADPVSLREVAASTRVVITTVGPYLHHGEPLVAACADAGTDYVDLTGEPEFIDLMYVRHHARAVETGARLVHACGFDSVPADLGALFTVGQLPPGSPMSVQGFVRAGGSISGGTFASVLLAFSRPRAMLRAARERQAVEPRPADRRAAVVFGPPRRSRDARAWVLPMPAVDPQIVARSAAALPAYGPDFRYGHYAAVKWLPVAVAVTAGLAVVALAAQLPPLRRAMSALHRPGQGPSEELRARSWFTVRFVGESDGQRVVTEVSGGDPGYGETAKILSESALCLAFDELPPTAGQLTTAAAMGPALIDRLSKAGISFTVLDTPPTDAPGPRRRS
ncbi:saccharopine dehydrogenase NADP-binding domain-containing protein [Kitasatospora paracochleata]|uniref:Saccharopine dehydrogenase (NAD+, L-glutamate forming) n=1 Tax=Kitasatospora paracochleata TaxID=58354 RepID=A0ABT1J7L8_9ACTN|nr:saccharopine dehydrogenase NADP-binding domain-containing protein [Kitasatospora paracochleata]MCP2313430.1 saccharopine dehydrogenase (NAD+, L-glutamate forming) [Kitasatospora paracochleata]